jgi:hypothetical protein
MTYRGLGQQVEELRCKLTPACLEEAIQKLLQQGEDVGGGVNASRMVKHLLGDPEMRNAEALWAYDRLKPALRAAFRQIPSLYYFEGD